MLTILGVVVTLLGSIYLIIEQLRTESMRDPIFTGALIGATTYLLSGMFLIRVYFDAHGPACFTELYPAEQDTLATHNYAACRAFVFSSRRMLLCGLAYGGILSLVPWIFGVWPEDLVLKILLSIFLFSVNLVTGCAIYSAIAFLNVAGGVARRMRISFWQRRSPSIRFILGVTIRSSLLASIYIGVCNSSVLFSEIPVRGLVYGYAIFAAIFFLILMLFPITVVALKLGESKTRELDDLDSIIERQLILARDEGLQNGGLALSNLEHLVVLKSTIAAMAVWPYRLRTILTVVGVLTSSLLPIAVDLIMTRQVSGR